MHAQPTELCVVELCCCVLFRGVTLLGGLFGCALAGETVLASVCVGWDLSWVGVRLVRRYARSEWGSACLALAVVYFLTLEFREAREIRLAYLASFWCVPRCTHRSLS